MDSFDEKFVGWWRLGNYFSIALYGGKFSSVFPFEKSQKLSNQLSERKIRVARERKANMCLENWKTHAFQSNSSHAAMSL